MSQILSLPKLSFKRIDSPDGRTYETPAGIKRSITTMLEDSSDPAGLNEWREWQGEATANQIVTLASGRGNRLHENIEKFCETGEEPPRSLLHTPYWNSIKPFLKRIRHTVLAEGPVYHPEGGAGTFDHLGYLDDDEELSLNDWKSADKLCNEGKLYKYKLQVAAYVAGINYCYKDYNVNVRKANVVVAIPNRKFQLVSLGEDELKQLFIHFQARTRYRFPGR